MDQVYSDEQGMRLSGALTVEVLPAVAEQVRRRLGSHARPILQVDLSRIERLDTAGAVFLRRLPTLAQEAGKELSLEGLPPTLQSFFDYIDLPPAPPTGQPEERKRLERLGDYLYRLYRRWSTFGYLLSDLSWSALSALFGRGGMRRGGFIDEAIAIGYRGLPIIALILFLIGAVWVLQSASQLRRYGANIFVADLLSLGIFRELGPLMTAIVVSGRSGSAIAAEIATMKFTEEIDALRTMGLDPLRFVGVPKLWAMLLSVPVLTIMGNCIGLAGGTLVAVLSLDFSLATFVPRMIEALVLKDVLTGLIKSVSFAWIITAIAVHQGLQFHGGADGVGRATTRSVVAALFGIIVLDSLWGLLFSFGGLLF